MPLFFVVLAFTLSWLGGIAANIALGSWAQGDPWLNYLLQGPDDVGRGSGSPGTCQSCSALWWCACRSV